jgi:hypothetical protein
VALPGGARLLVAFAGELGPEIVAAPRSPGYAELVDGFALELAGRVLCPVELATAFLQIF